MNGIPNAIEWLILGNAIGLLAVGCVVAALVIIGLVRRKIDALDLITIKGKLAEEKIFTILGKFACLFVMLKDASDGQPTIELQLSMAALIFAHELFKRGQSIGLDKAKLPEDAAVPAKGGGQ